MYSKSYVGGEQPPEKIKIPPDYDGSALFGESPPGPAQATDRSRGSCNTEAPSEDHIPSNACATPKKPSILDKFKTEDVILLAAAAFLIFREENDILSLGILILIILL